MRLLLSRGTRRALGFALPPDSGSEDLSEAFRRARVLADRLAPLMPEGTRVTAGDIYGLERLERALAAYLDRVLREREPDLLARLLSELDQEFGTATVDRLLAEFEDEFLPDRADPISVVETGSNSGDSTIPGRRRRELLADLVVFSVVHSNPASSRLNHLFHFGGLVADPAYERVIGHLEELLDRAPGLHDGDPSLLRGLRRPIEAAPDSIADQLLWLQRNWSDLDAALEFEFLAAIDLIAEEVRPRFPPGPGPVEAPAIEDLEDADVRYGSDRSWMASLVLAAKNAQVWLHQLSVRHQREIIRLDQVPDAELQTLADRGVTGLWLIGLWERSRASQRIKRLCGNPEAAGSAYSLVAYRIADDLGGDEALAGLEGQAARFGIRLSADMVPNHTGIDSEWMIERPEYFLSVPVCPYPAYTFDGPNLSEDPRVSLFLEDHYYDQSDAAVVFKRVDNRSGEVRFVYHGNDGTSTPWNDTAQLDYLNPDTREAVTQAILDVARRFPIIRFDAAMTLARRHIRRLWHPEPGAAGAIPSRAEHAISASRFDSQMPREFWRDVVDRAESEAPNTLLMAEAFWLMEGYFVRNLGLHRVYNSAFMNMIRDGDNRGFRKLIRESLDFDPEILKRYVNFLSNPDEKTAIEQFGDGDRYFGACLLLATLPGLPMLAHGQIEGLTERYGMEYRRAYVDEVPNQRLIERHEREIFPLLRERARFANVDDFDLHDFVGETGAVDENVLAFSHGTGEDTSVIVFNNQFATVRGVLRLDRDLGTSGATNQTCTFAERQSGLHFLRAASAVHDRGLELELAGYQSAVLVGFRELAEDQDIYRRLEARLGLSGVPSLETAARDTKLATARGAFGEVLATLSVVGEMSAPTLLAVEERLENLDRALQRSTGSEPITRGLASTRLDAWFEAISRLAAVEPALDWPATERMLSALERFLVGSETKAEARYVLTAFALLGYLQRRWGSSALIELEPQHAAGRVLAEAGVAEERARELTALLEHATASSWLEAMPPPGREEATRLLAQARGGLAASLLGYDRETDRVSRNRLDRYLTWRATAAALSWLARPADPSPESSVRGQVAEAVVGWCDVLERLRTSVEDAEFMLEPVLETLRGRNRPVISGEAGDSETAV